MTGPREGQGSSVPADANPSRSRLTNSTSTDLLVCFPSRTRLSLIPHRVCSPARPFSEPSDPLRRRPGGLGRSYSAVGLGRASPLVRNKGGGGMKRSDQRVSEITEPTSPRVTCSGQIRARPSTAATACRRVVRSDAEEVERIPAGGTKQSRSKSLGWSADGHGSKKEGMQQQSTGSRRTWLDLRCFGCSFPESRLAGDARGSDDRQNSKADAIGTMFAKWFMVLQQDNRGANNTGGVRGKDIISVVDLPPGNPPPENALLLMRCRSTPTISWSQGTESDQDGYERRNDGEIEEEKDRGGPTNRMLDDSLVMTRFEPALNQSPGVSQKEAQTVDEPGPNPLTRSKSWKT